MNCSLGVGGGTAAISVVAAAAAVVAAVADRSFAPMVGNVASNTNDVLELLLLTVFSEDCRSTVSGIFKCRFAMKFLFSMISSSLKSLPLESPSFSSSSSSLSSYLYFRSTTILVG